MKHRLLLTLLLFSSIVYSQRTVENPRIGMSTMVNLKIEKIELRDTATVIWFYLNTSPGLGFSIPGQSFIQPVGAKEKLYVKTSEGIKINEQNTMSAAGEIRYQLYFPKIDASVSKLDYGEANEAGNLFIYDIQLKPELLKSIVPKQFMGNWFRADNAQWEISLFDTVAVYKGQVWNYAKYSEMNGIGKINLKKKSKVLTVYVQPINDNTCMFGETAGKLAKYTHQPDESVISEDSGSFKLPIFKNDTVTYCGYLKGFNPRYSQRTGMIYVNNVLTGNQDSYLIKIDVDGTFNAKFVLPNPQLVLLRIASLNDLILLEPGKSLFQMIDENNQSMPNLFMGDLSRINTDIAKLKGTYSLNFEDTEKQKRKSSPNEFKEYLLNFYTKDLSSLEALRVKCHIGGKAYQVWKMELDYCYATKFMEYANENEKTMSIETDSDYFSFSTNELANNPLAILTANYYFYINRVLMYNFRKENSAPKLYTVPEICFTLENAGYAVSPEAKKLALRMKDYNTPEIKKLQVEFRQKYSNQIKDFYKKYSEKIQLLYKEKSDSVITLAILENYLSQHDVMLTNKEKEFIQSLKELIHDPMAQQLVFFLEINDPLITQFYENYIRIGALVTKISKRNDKLKKVLGISPGFATDLMASDDFCRSIVASMTPISDENIKAYQKGIGTPFIANFIEQKINASRLQIEANKKQKGSVANEVPKTQDNKVFDAILEKYKGKLIYVDFWATWCAPCRAGIEQIKPLKVEMANENVVFVYITNESSPKTSYDKMIPGIKGEHFRLSTDEWNTIAGMFKIGEIPRYMLVGKDGKVINSQLEHLGNEQLKALLMKHLKNRT